MLLVSSIAMKSISMFLLHHLPIWVNETFPSFASRVKCWVAICSNAWEVWRSIFLHISCRAFLVSPSSISLFCGKTRLYQNLKKFFR